MAWFLAQQANQLPPLLIENSLILIILNFLFVLLGTVGMFSFFNCLYIISKSKMATGQETYYAIISEHALLVSWTYAAFRIFIALL